MLRAKRRVSKNTKRQHCRQLLAARVFFSKIFLRTLIVIKGSSTLLLLTLVVTRGASTPTVGVTSQYPGALGIKLFITSKLYPGFNNHHLRIIINHSNHHQSFESLSRISVESSLTTFSLPNSSIIVFICIFICIFI